MRLTYEKLNEIERHFGIKNGAWTREAVSYVGLSHPLKKGWKQDLIQNGTSEYAPIAIGMKPEDHMWVSGKDVDDDDMIDTVKQMDLYNEDPAAYVKRQLNVLEDAVDVLSDKRYLCHGGLHPKGGDLLDGHELGLSKLFDCCGIDLVVLHRLGQLGLHSDEAEDFLDFSVLLLLFGYCTPHVV